MPRRLLIATTNPHKIREIRSLLSPSPVELVTLAEMPPVAEPDETGATFEENARLKALYYSEKLAGETGEAASPWVVAEDSGLAIDALDGEPGVRSARFLGARASYAERFAEIEQRLRRRPDAPRTARFVCALAVAEGRTVIFEAVGTVEGLIDPEPRGTAGFGYDPIFFYPPYGQTLAEVTDEAKLRVAHRGHAFRELARWLEKRAEEWAPD